MYSYPSWSKEYHASRNLLGKWYKVVYFQLFDASLSKMVFVMNSPTFSQQTKQISEGQILHDHDWVPFKYKCNVDLRWLKTVSSTFQDVEFDGSLLPLFINECYNHGVKKLSNHWWTRWYYFRDIIDYHSNTMTR